MQCFRAVILLLCICLLSSGPVLAQQAGQHCLAYEPAVVKLRGTIVSRTYPGPPEYESIRQGDEPETYWLLVLPRPVCVDEQPAEFNPAQKGVRKIQLVFLKDGMYRRYRSLLGRRVEVTGTLFAGFTIHHKTPLLVTVATLRGRK